MSTIVVHFIGLIMFTADGGGGTGKPYTVTAIAPIVSACIDTHTTMILFKDATSVTGWTAGSTVSGWSYVTLSGPTRVEFVAEGTNGDVTALTSVSLPHVGGTTLKADFKEPYSGAQAVFTITKGTLAACGGKRVDTNLSLNVDDGKTLTIKSGANSIVLPRTATVAIVNLPFTLINDPASYKSIGMAHNTMYCAMTNRLTCSLTRPTVSPCDTVIIPETLLGTDFFCSNSQWP